MKTSPRPSESNDGLRKAVLGYALAMSLALDLGVCIAIGVWADRRQGTMPLWTLVGVVVGGLVGAGAIWAVNRAMKQKTTETTKP